MKNSQDECIFAFFYAPGANHDEKKREEFYDELRKGIDRYKENKIYLMGDSNARLGEYSGDRDINGKFQSNKNKALFIGLVEYTGLKYLNRIYEKGKPTYEIWGKKKSIIDVALTNNIEQIENFEVKPQILGANAQTAHKIIKITLRAKVATRNSERKKIQRFRHCSWEALIRVRGEVARKCKILRMIRGERLPNIFKYDVIRRMYHNAKVKCVGYRKGRRKSVPVSTAIRTMQARIKQTTRQIEKQMRKDGDKQITKRKRNELVQRYQIMEKELYKQCEIEKQMKWAQWIKKLNALDYHKATRSFYAEVRGKCLEEEELGPIVNGEGTLSTTLEECLENWRNFYEKLYSTPEAEEEIENERDNIKQIPTEKSEMQKETLDKQITIEEIVEAAFALKTNTAAGSDSILSSDIQVLLETSIGSEKWKNIEILKFLQKMINKLWDAEKVPEGLKEIVIRPFLKKTDKDPAEPSNYRPVALLNVLTKLYEHIIVARLTAYLERNNLLSSLQAVYRKGRSTADHIFTIQEIFYYYRYKKGKHGKTGEKQPLYFAFIDLTKAFDTVSRYKLFKKLRLLGVQGKMYRVIIDLYTNNKAQIKIGEYTSESLRIKSGLIQGSKLGPILFNIFINDLLKELEDSQLGVVMPNILVTALGYADDIVLIADHPSKLQKQINICERWSRRNGMRFNTEKCKVLPLNVGMKGPSLTISGKSIEKVKSMTYLGITLSRSRLTTLYGKHVTKVLEKAEARANVIRHMGFQRDGLRPETSIKMYKTLVRPILEYATQVLSYRHYYFKERNSQNIEEPTEIIRKLENFQNRVLKKIVPCPRNTPPAVLRLITGIMPISGRIDMLKLRYFWRLQKTKNKNAAHQVYLGIRQNFLKGNQGCIHEVFNLCCKYSRMDIWHGLCPEKENPLMRIKKIVELYHLKKDVEVARKVNCIYTEMTTFMEKKYTFEEKLKRIGQFENTDHRRVFIYAMLETPSYEKDCKNCGKKVKDITIHGMEECEKVEHHRKVYRMRMRFYNAKQTMNLLNKMEAFRAALRKKSFMKVLCDFLMVIWKR